MVRTFFLGLTIGLFIFQATQAMAGRLELPEGETLHKKSKTQETSNQGSVQSKPTVKPRQKPENTSVTTAPPQNSMSTNNPGPSQTAQTHSNQPPPQKTSPTVQSSVGKLTPIPENIKSDPKKLYNFYKKLPSKDKASKNAVLTFIMEKFPASKEGIKAAKKLAGQQSYLVGPWNDLPSKALFIENFLKKAGLKGKQLDSMESYLAKIYLKNGRFDLWIHHLEKRLAAVSPKSYKRFKYCYKIALGYAFLGDKEKSAQWFDKALKIARPKSADYRKAQFALDRIKHFSFKPINLAEYPKQNREAAKIFATMKPFKKSKLPGWEQQVALLAQKYPQTYHGRQAQLKLAKMNKGPQGELKKYQMWLSFLKNYPLSPEAEKVAKKLKEKYKALGMWGEMARLAQLRLNYAIDIDDIKFRDKCREMALIWAKAGQWDKSVVFLAKALALKGDFNSLPSDLTSLAKKAKGKIYLPSELTHKIIESLLKNYKSSAKTAQGLLEMAQDYIRDDHPKRFIWPDLFTASLLLSEVPKSFPNTPQDKKSKKILNSLAEEMGLWSELAQKEEAEFKNKYKGRKRIYSHDAFDLAAAYQRAGKIKKAENLLKRLLGQKRLSQEDRKKADLIVSRLKKIKETPVLSQAEKDNQTKASEKLYVELRNIWSRKMPYWDREKVLKPIMEKRKKIVEKLKQNYPNTYHGCKAARCFVVRCFPDYGQKMSSQCYESVVKYLDHYYMRFDSKNLWKEVINLKTQEKDYEEVALLRQKAMLNWAHLWDLDEQKQAFVTAESWIKSGNEIKALPWFEQVVALDETGESRLAKKADKFIRQIKTRHPNIVKAKPDKQKALSIKEQKKLGKALMAKAAKTPKQRLKDFKEIYTEIINRCPDTEFAEMAYWRLSNLYLLAYSEPQNDKLIPLLEEFLAKYPKSKGVPHVRRRLVVAYERTGKFCKAADQTRKGMLHGEFPPQEDQAKAFLKLFILNLKKCGREAERKSWLKLMNTGKKPHQIIKLAKEKGLLK